MNNAFSKQAIIDAATTAIAALQADLDDHYQRVLKYREDHRQKWFRERKALLREARNALTVALNNGKPVTQGMIEKSTGYRFDTLFYSPPADYTIGREVGTPRNGTRKEVQDQLENYRGVVKLLEAYGGDQITMNQLRLMGITKIGALFNAAARQVTA